MPAQAREIKWVFKKPSKDWAGQEPGLGCTQDGQRGTSFHTLISLVHLHITYAVCIYPFAIAASGKEVTFSQFAPPPSLVLFALFAA